MKFRAAAEGEILHLPVKGLFQPAVGENVEGGVPQESVAHRSDGLFQQLGKTRLGQLEKINPLELSIGPEKGELGVVQVDIEDQDRPGRVHPGQARITQGGAGHVHDADQRPLEFLGHAEQQTDLFILSGGVLQEVAGHGEENLVRHGGKALPPVVPQEKITQLGIRLEFAPEGKGRGLPRQVVQEIVADIARLHVPDALGRPAVDEIVSLEGDKGRPVDQGRGAAGGFQRADRLVAIAYGGLQADVTKFEAESRHDLRLPSGKFLPVPGPAPSWHQ